MPEDRLHMPAALRRAVKEEAGYRCAIPTCKGTSGLQVAHIIPYAVNEEHRFDNLILLCAVCHIRFDSGEIPRQSILVYKANLSLLSHRYTQVENQLLSYFGDIELEMPGEYVPIHPGMSILYLNLLEDGIVRTQSFAGVTTTINGIEPNIALVLTDKGADLVRQIVSAESIE